MLSLRLVVPQADVSSVPLVTENSTQAIAWRPIPGQCKKQVANGDFTRVKGRISCQMARCSLPIEPSRSRCLGRSPFGWSGHRANESRRQSGDVRPRGQALLRLATTSLSRREFRGLVPSRRRILIARLRRKRRDCLGVRRVRGETLGGRVYCDRVSWRRHSGRRPGPYDRHDQNRLRLCRVVRHKS